MSAAEVLAPAISEPLTWDEICARYPDEWVCVVEIDRIHSNGFEFRTARVIGHGKTRRASFDQARPLREHYPLVGHYYTGCVEDKPLRPVVIMDEATRDAFRYPR